VKKYSFGTVVALAAMAFVATSTQAATYNGSVGGASFSMPDNTAWGTPSFVFGNTIFFNGSSFNVDTSSATTQVDDRLEIDIHMPSGVKLGEIVVSGYGSWSVNGEGAEVHYTMPIDALDLDLLGTADSQAAAVTPQSFPIIAGQNGVPLSASGSFTAVNNLDISNELLIDGNNVRIGLETHTLAIGANGSSASLDLNLQDLKLEFYFIPEPATLSLLLVGGMALVRRRRM